MCVSFWMLWKCEDKIEHKNFALILVTELNTVIISLKLKRTLTSFYRKKFEKGSFRRIYIYFFNSQVYTSNSIFFHNLHAVASDCFSVIAIYRFILYVIHLIDLKCEESKQIALQMHSIQCWIMMWHSNWKSMMKISLLPIKHRHTPSLILHTKNCWWYYEKYATPSIRGFGPLTR